MVMLCLEMHLCPEKQTNITYLGVARKRQRKVRPLKCAISFTDIESDIGPRHGLQNELARTAQTKGKEKQFVLFLAASS